MSSYKTTRNSFVHIFNKHGIEAVRNHSYIHRVIKVATHEPEWFHIDVDVARILVRIKETKNVIACKEALPEDSNHYGIVTENDLDKEGQFPSHWKTFIITL